MGKISIDFKDNQYSNDNSVYSRLCVSIGSEKLILSVLNNKGQVDCFRSYTLESSTYTQKNIEILDLLATDKLFSLTYYRSYIGLFSPNISIIPSKLFIRKHVEAYLSSVCNFDPEQFQVHENSLTEIDAHLVFPVSNDLNVLFSGKLGQAMKPLNLAVPLLKVWKKNTSAVSGNQLFIHVYEGYAFIALFHNKELQLGNYFAFQSAKDLVYFSMLVFNQFGIKTEETPVILSGNIIPSYEIHHLLLRFIPEVSFFNLTSHFSLGDTLTDIPTHQYIDLFSLILCE